MLISLRVAIGMQLLQLAVGAPRFAADEACDQEGLERAEEDVDLASLLQIAYPPEGAASEIQEQALTPQSEPLTKTEQDHISPYEDRKVGIYHFSSRGGNPQTSSSTNNVGPTNFSKFPKGGTVLFKNPEDEEIRHTPLIDDEKNIYITSTTHIWKFTDAGKQVWDYFVPEKDGMMTTSPALYDGVIYAMAYQTGGTAPTVTAFSVNMTSGKLGWKEEYARKKGGDSQGVLVYNDTVILPVLNKFSDGSDSVLALKSADGKMLWEYKTDDVMWNFKPSTTGDGSIIFASACGAVHNIDFDGKLIWKKGAVSTPPPGGMCSMGGGAVGPNGVFYTQHGTWHLAPDGQSHINAYNISDGKNLWSKTLDEFGGQYPAVGRLGKDGPLAVVAPIGSGLTPDPTGGNLGPDKSKWLVNAVVALDAATGDLIWRFEEPHWPFAAAANDFGEPMAGRVLAKLTHPRQETVCLPDPQGIPLISGDGHVYGTSSHSGDLYALKDLNGDKKVEGPDEVSTFETKVTFLNSPSLAPGMLIAAPCWGPVYIFKEVEVEVKVEVEAEAEVDVPLW